MKRKFVIDFLEDYSKESLIRELKRIQKIVGNRPITKSDISKYGNAVWSTYFRKFGTFSKALLAAGLKPSKRMNVSNEELIDAVITLWTKTLEKDGRRPFTSDLEKYEVPYSKDTYRRRFGNWRRVLITAYKSVGKKMAWELKENKQKKNKPVDRPQRKPLSERKRFLVFKRDQFACVLCGRSGVGVRIEVDHKIPVAKGGTDDLSNLQTLCFECNRGKRTDIIGVRTR